MDRRNHKRLRGKVATGLAWLLIIIGLVAAAWALILTSRRYVSAPQPPTSVTRSVAEPSSVKPSAKTVAAYTVPSDKPKYISIPAINLSTARVFPLGLTGSNKIASPNNLYDTGWYSRSALPGELGAMFIYGHVSSWKADGVFHDLQKIKSGYTVTITSGDNKIFTYRVVTSKVYNYPKVDMEQVLMPVEAGKPGLNLMTCTGQIMKGTSEFNQRLVVFTSLVGS